MTIAAVRLPYQKAKDAQLHPGKEGVGKPSRLPVGTHFGDNNTRIGYCKDGRGATNDLASFVS